MGEVHLARDSLLDRLVAVKFISGAEPDPKVRERFLVEARAIARLQHENVVSIYRVGEVGDVPYLVSEYVDGQSLSRLKRPTPWRNALRVGTGIARALAAAHQRGVLHRDIKPANVILTAAGNVKLLDFGIAKLLDEAQVGEHRARPSLRDVRVARPCSLPPPGDLPTLSVPVPAGDISISTAPDDAPTASVPCVAPAVHIASVPPRLTEIGFVVGTPAYMAPEVLRGEPATFRSDVFSLGVLLFELCAGRLPHPARRPDAKDVLRRPPSLAVVAPGVDEGFAAVVDRCLDPDPQMRFASGNEVRAALAQLTPEARLEAVPEGNPYPGLRAFDSSRAGLYFGRDSEVRAVLERLSGEGFVLVAGDSGVGKSSLCRAGVLPRVQRWFGSRRVWSSLTLTPGRAPVRALAAALAPFAAGRADEVERLVEQDPGGLVRILLERLDEAEGLVIFVDQLEEVVTACDPSDADAFGSALDWLATARGSLRVLASARSDFLGRLANLPSIGERIAPALYFLRPLTAERVREAIVAPARSKGVRFESSEMVEALVESASEAEGGLPLLQFALAELWETKPPQTQVLTRAAFDGLGGVRGALARHADRVFAAMRPELRRAAENVLRGLVSGRDTRIRRTAAELGAQDPTVREAVETLVSARLVVACDGAEGTGYEIAHEALIRSWGTLVRLLASDAEARVVRERLGLAVQEWERLGRARGALWSRDQLRDAQILEAVDLSACERSFLDASKRQRRLRIGAAFGATLAVVLAVGGTYGGVVHAERKRLEQSVDEALGRANRELARAESLASDARRAELHAFAKFDRRDPDAERAWSGAKALRAKVVPTLDEAERHLESAVLLDGTRRDVHAQFSRSLLMRAEDAEQRDDRVERDRALERVAIYDPSGDAAAAWHRPVEVRVSASPPGASVALEEWSASGGFVPWEGEPAWLLPHGSYRAVFRHAGYATLRLPFVVRRGESPVLRAELVPEREVPDGFLYVPAGTGWFGSGAEDSLRSGFFNAEPLHEVHTDAFLIARHETTFGAWLAYLRALPPEARLGALPRVESGGFSGSLQVVQRDDAFDLVLRLGKQVHRVPEGRPLALSARGVRKKVDWLRMPVTGISALDAAAYAAWLDRSGRVPGARLCTEHEWERAARGADRRTYPHGDRLDSDDANIDETYGKVPEAMAPDEVGSHPASRSPFGVDDMAGNAWEWTRDERAAGAYVARGGSFFYDAQVARIENRETPEATFRDASVGVRICADVARESGVSSQNGVPSSREKDPS